MSLIRLPEPEVAIVARRDQIVAELIAIAGRDAVIFDEDGRRAFETDALTSYRRMPMAVVLPQSTEAVANVMRYCNTNGVKVIARGAGTSLCGGALPAEDAIVIGVSKMNRVLDIDPAGRTMRVETGITNIGMTAAVAGQGFFYAPDPSSQLACTLAGNLGMNSGGAHCLKYGVTTNNVLGVRMVLMTGEVVDIGGPYVDAAGYDLLALVIGSEGQMGIVTEATVRILKAPEGARPMLLGFDSSEAAGRCVAAIIASGIIPVAIEFMDKPAIEVCEAYAKAGYPLDVEALLIIEVEGSEAEISERLGQMLEIAKPFRPSSHAISQSAEHSAKIWKGRKSAFGALGRISDYYCMDGTIPLGRLSETLTAISHICTGYGLKVANIFHAGDGNLHPLIMFDANDPASEQRAEQAGADILSLCVEVGGCLTGEHGVGIEKRDLMSKQFTPVDLLVQMRLKSVFDPRWLLNPAKVFPLEASAAEAQRSALPSATARAA
jgi:glycolate oxidase